MFWLEEKIRITKKIRWTAQMFLFLMKVCIFKKTIYVRPKNAALRVERISNYNSTKRAFRQVTPRFGKLTELTKLWWVIINLFTSFGLWPKLDIARWQVILTYHGVVSGNKPKRVSNLLTWGRHLEAVVWSCHLTNKLTTR